MNKKASIISQRFFRIILINTVVEVGITSNDSLKIELNTLHVGHVVVKVVNNLKNIKVKTMQCTYALSLLHIQHRT